MSSPDPFAAAAEKIDAILKERDVRLTLGGEPTYVPENPTGSEWNITALGPTKLRYAYALADALIAQSLPNAVAFYTPGKCYPGELNPRWTIVLVWNRDGSPLVPALARNAPHRQPPTREQGDRFRADLLKRLELTAGWLRAIDPFATDRYVWVLPLDHDSDGFHSEDWEVGDEFELVPADGPAGLRLPLQDLPEECSRRALAIEFR